MNNTTSLDSINDSNNPTGGQPAEQQGEQQPEGLQGEQEEGKPKEQRKPEKFRFYEQKYPRVGSRVVFRFGKMEDQKLVRVTLPEYLDREACILLKELTNRKRVKSYQQLCPTGQMGVGEVTTCEHDGDYIFLTAKTLSEKEKEEYLEWYVKSKRLLSFMRRISMGCGRSLECMCHDISWPLYARHWLQMEGNVEEKYHTHPLDTIDHPSKLNILCIEWEDSDDVESEVELGGGGEKSRKAQAPASAAQQSTEAAEEEQAAEMTKTTMTLDSALEDAPGNWNNPEQPPDMAQAQAQAHVKVLRMSSDSVRLLEEWHEDFFGKPVYNRSFRFGLLSYGIEGSEQVKTNLMKASSLVTQNYPDVEVELIARDLPIYELKLKSLEEGLLNDAVSAVTSLLANSGLLFRPLPN